MRCAKTGSQKSAGSLFNGNNGRNKGSLESNKLAGV